MLKFKLLRRTIRLSWSIIFSAMLTMALMLMAGFWQLDRAEQKVHMAEDYKKASDLQPLEFPVTEFGPEEINYRQVKTRGRYLSEKQFLLDNRIVTIQGRRQVGYQVLTPLITNSNTVILVDRGWLVADVNRNILPNVSVDEGYRDIEGIMTIPAEPFRLGDADYDRRWPRVITYIDFVNIAHRLGADIYPAILVLNKEQQDAYTYNWKAVIKGPWIHYGYAAQWFAMCVMLLIALLIVGLNAGRREY